MRCQLIANPNARARVDLGGFCRPDRAPLYFHRKLPGYAPTPLVAAPHLAERLGVREVIIKDESCRLGLPSFKILGASWAVYKAIVEQWGVEAGVWSNLDELRQRLRPLGKRTLAAATDGNHGRAVARMARLFGWHARIFVPAGTTGARIRAIKSEGATVTVVQGTYDDAVERSASEESATTLVISDTSWPGYERSPQHVIEAYSTIFHEVADKLAREGLAQPSVVAIQAGVGSLAAASVLYFRTGASESPPGLVVVEPENANCVLESARAGRPTQVPGPHRSIMAGLNCGRPSPLAFPLLLQGVDAFVTVDDESAREAMRALAKVSIVAGPSGAAGLAGLLAAAEGDRPEYRQVLGLAPDARVLVINTEGATDPEEYAAIVGGDETGGGTHAR
jgi:diaminopropionate ammonia-lyase